MVQKICKLCLVTGFIDTSVVNHDQKVRVCQKFTMRKGKDKSEGKKTYIYKKGNGEQGIHNIKRNGDR